MKKLLTLFSACLIAITSVQAQCDLDFSFANTGTNMTAFFTPPAASAIYAELGDGTLGAFFINSDGEYVCGTSVAFTGSQVQLAVMADDSTTPEKDGFSSGESINWFYQTIDGVYSVSVSPDDIFAINAISFISSASVEAVDCGGGTPTDECPPLDFEVVNTGSNMTLFVTNGSLLSDLGNGTVGVYFIDDNGLEVCGGSQSFSGGQVQIAAMGDDATSTEKDGFSAGEAIIWKFESNDGSQYNLTPSPQDVFTLNATSFVIGMANDAISCAVDLEGCTDDTYVEYNPQASIDDGSCATVAIFGCTDSNYVEYDANANVDDGSCVTVSLDGCTDASACNYNSAATTDDGSCYNNDLGCGCDTPAADEGYDCDGNCLNDSDDDGICDEDEVVGCQDPLADNYDSSATDAGDCEYAGCTDANYLEYDSSANVDNGSCTTLIVEGCTDSNATNYDSSANTSDGSCEYDLIGAGCSVSFDVLNTGSNATIMVPGISGSPLNVGDMLGVFYIAEDGSAQCAGSSEWTGANMQIVAFGDDATTDEVDGLLAGDPYLFIAQSGDDIYMVSADYSSTSPNTSFTINGITFINDLSFEMACTVEYLGCTDASACNYDSTANTDDGSCYNNDLGCGCDTPAADDGYDCDGNCLNDSDDDGICDEDEVVGCQDPSAANYDSSATDAGDCTSWEEAYEDCLSSGGDDGITQADVDAVQDLLDLANNSLESAISNIAMLEEQLNEALANQEDGVTQADVDAIQAQLDASVIEVSSLNNIIASLEFEVSESNSTIAALEAQIDEILANCGDDGITQADVDAVQALLDVANISITDLQSELEAALANQEDGVSQADVDAAYADGVASVIPEDGITQADVDAVQLLLNTANESNSDLQSQLDAALENQEDGITQADLDEANIQITDLQAQLEEALANGGGSCESIYVELLQGWNIIGYTLSYPQDVAATMASIVDDVQIVKNNSAAVYWPEYAFNGIGDYIPGQGYQIRMHNAISSYTFPDVDGERLEMIPTVPAWVHDLPVLNHPNDTRSLVRVVNMLGQEVNPEEQFIGEILLYLYSDGSTEKLMVE